jgi:hypothetical protein
MQIDTDTLRCPACKSDNIQYCGGVYECLECGVEGPVLAFKAWRAPIPTDKLRKALEKAYLAGWRDSGQGYNSEFPEGASDKPDWIARRDKAFSILGFDALAKALGAQDEKG